MAKLTLDDLRRMREEKQKAMDMRDSSNKDIQVIVGMGTCGIAAGAKDTFTALIDALNEKGFSFDAVKRDWANSGFLVKYNGRFKTRKGINGKAPYCVELKNRQM